MIKAVLFDLDDTLYDTTLQVKLARENAVKAMVDAGLDADVEEAEKALEKVVVEKGPNYQRHYDDMLSALGARYDPKIVAAGIVAYHEAKTAYLVPYQDTVKTLLELRGRGLLLGVVTDGVQVKQWEKLIRLGLMDFFHTVVIASESDEQKPSPTSYMKAASNLGLKPVECMVVGDRADKDILGGRKAGMKTVQIVSRRQSKPPSNPDEEPDYIITRLNDLLRIIGGAE